MSGTTRVLLVRHGQTAWNIAARFQGHTDSPLTEIGVAQAKSLGARLKGESITAVYSSDLGRALQTADYITEFTGHEVRKDARLRERGLGVFEGLDKSGITERFPEAAARYYSRDPYYVVPGGESTHGHLEKGMAALNELAKRHAGGTILIITHGGLVSSVFRSVAGIDLGAERHYSLKNAAYNCFTLEAGRWAVDTWGDTSHFPPALRGTGKSFVETSPDENTDLRR